MPIITDYVKNFSKTKYQITALSCTKEMTWIPLKDDEGKSVKDLNGNEVYVKALCRANKGFSDGFVQAYSHATGKWLQYNEVQVCDFKEFSEFLTSIAGYNQTFITRGELIEGLIDKNSIDPKDYVRNGHVVYLDKSKTTFFRSNANGVKWVMFDIDKNNTPKGLNIIDNHKECAEYIISLLPAYFHNCSYHYQLSSKARKNPKKIKMHLFFWFEEPLTDAEVSTLSDKINNYYLAKILETYTGDVSLISNLLDTSVTTASQPHYTAAPSFDNPDDDPYKEGRNFTIFKGSDSVKIPPEVLVAVKEIAKKAVQLKYYEGLVDYVNPFCKWAGVKYSSWFEDALKGIGYKYGHDGVFQSAKAYIAQVKVEFSDTVALKKEIISYIENLPDNIHELNGGSYTKGYLLNECSDSIINPQIKKALAGAITKEKAKAESAEKDKFTDGEFSGTNVKKYSTIEEGMAILDVTYDNFFDNLEDTLVCITPGSGKTTEFCEKAKTKHLVDLKGDLFFVNHSLAHDAKLKLLKAPKGKPAWASSGAVVLHPYARHWQWEDTEEYKYQKKLNPNYRDLVCIDFKQQDRKMCYSAEAAEILSKKGLAIYPKLCHTRVKTPKPNGESGFNMKEVLCDRYYDCGFMKTYNGESSWQIVTFIKDGKTIESFKQGYFNKPDYTHRLLMTNVLGQEKSALLDYDPDYSMADEGVFDKLIEQTARNSKVFTFDSIDKIPFSKALKLALKGADPELPLLKQIKAIVGEQQLLIDLDATLKMLKEKGGSETFIGMSIDEQNAAAKNIKNPNRAMEFVTRLRKEFLLGKDVCNSVTRKRFIDSKTNKVTYLNEYTLQYRKDITRLGIAPIIFLNGDYTPELYIKIRKDVKIVSVEIEAKAHIIQVYDRTCSSTRIKDDVDYFVKNIQKLIDSFEEDTKVAVIGLGYLTGNANGDEVIMAKLKVNKSSWLEHYGNQRGKNTFEDADVVITISDNNPRSQDLISAASGFYYDDVEPILDDLKLFRKVEKTYTTKCGFSRVVDVYEHSDPRVMDMHSAIRDCEVIQAGHRGRFIHSTKPKLWIALASIPLDRVGGVTPDNLVTFEEACNRETKLSKVLQAADGCLPLSVKYLTEKHPDLGSGKDWENYFQNQVGGINLPALRNASLLSTADSAEYKLYLYKTKGTPKPSKCLSKYDFNETLSRLSVMVPIVKLLDNPEAA